VPLFRYCPQCGSPLPIEVIPARDVLRQDCPVCGAAHYRNAKPCAGALVVRDGCVLLGRRNREPYLGWWDIPGGFLEPWEHPAAGAVREVAEETGLTVRPTELLGIFIDTYGEGDGADYTLNVYYLVEIVGGETRPADDLAELAWFAAGSLPEQIAFPHARDVLGFWERHVDSRPPNNPGGG
jgi:ADP-ribose pyrophosphatase YjhB (NUDIX family)